MLSLIQDLELQLGRPEMPFAIIELDKEVVIQSFNDERVAAGRFNTLQDIAGAFRELILEPGPEHDVIWEVHETIFIEYIIPQP